MCKERAVWWFQRILSNYLGWSADTNIFHKPLRSSGLKMVKLCLAATSAAFAAWYDGGGMGRNGLPAGGRPTAASETRPGDRIGLCRPG